MVKRWKLRELSSDLAERIRTPAHFGVLVPWANMAMEAELPCIFPPQVVWHFARLVPSSRTTAIDEDFLHGMVEAVPHGIFQLSNLPLEILAFGCTSASFSFPEAVFTHLATLMPSISFITAFSAIVHMLEYYGAGRTVLVTPYVEEVTRLEVRALENSGIRVIDSVSLGYRDGIGNIRTKELLSACSKCAVSSLEAIVMSCTALHTVEAIRILEAQYHVPVISSNTAIALASALLYTEHINSEV